MEDGGRPDDAQTSQETLRLAGQGTRGAGGSEGRKHGGLEHLTALLLPSCSGVLFTGGVFSKMRSPVAQAGFGLLILLPLPPEWLDYRHAPPLTMI